VKIRRKHHKSFRPQWARLKLSKFVKGNSTKPHLRDVLLNTVKTSTHYNNEYITCSENKTKTHLVFEL